MFYLGFFGRSREIFSFPLATGAASIYSKRSKTGVYINPARAILRFWAHPRGVGFPKHNDNNSIRGTSMQLTTRACRSTQKRGPRKPLLASGMSLIVILPFAATATELHTGIDEQAQLPFWELQDRGMSLRLVQRLPDQTRAFFLARGFSRDDAELIAQSCVFQTVFRNTSNESDPDPVSYDQRKWVVSTDNGNSGMKTREAWEAVWTERNAPKAARIAFQWALYPTEQTYQPGDYNWGMSTTGLPPGSKFDLEVTWHQYDSVHSALIRDMRCAPDDSQSE